MARKSKIDRLDLGDQVTRLVADGQSTRAIAEVLGDGFNHVDVHRWISKNLGPDRSIRSTRSIKTELKRADATGQAFFGHLLGIVEDSRRIMNDGGEPARVREKALEVAAACAIEGYNLASYKLQIEQIVSAGDGAPTT